MEIGSEFFSSTKIAEPRVLPRPKLLLELEPAHRVFFSNLLDTLLFRPAPRVATTSRPGRFWPDVFIEPEMPWWGFLESMLWHMLAVAGIWSISQGVALRNQPFQRPSARRTYISYYRPSPTFPVAAARAPRPEPSPAVRREPAHQSALRVAREGRRGVDAAAPSLKLGRKGAPNLAGAGASLPEMPFSATRRSRLSVPAGPNALVAPPPEVYEAAGWRGGLPQASVVAPPPDASTLASRRGLGAPGVAVVEPPPSVQGALRKFGDVNIGHTEVVAPAPQLPMHEQRAGVGVEQAGLGGSSASVVPPPPSIQRSGTLHGARGGSMASSGMQVVPPPPSVQEAGNAGMGRAGALSSNSVQVVPPPPSVEGVGDSAGRGQGTALTGDNFGVVPPAPSARGIGSPAGKGRGTSLAGSGLQVVPPPPSIDGVGNGAGGGRGTAISGGGLEVVPPAPSTRGLGGSGGSSGRGGSLGGTGLQASGPAMNGQGFGSTGGRGRNSGSSGKGSSAGAGTEMASALGGGSGGVGRGSGAGASGRAVGSGNGKGEAGSGTSNTTGAGTAGATGGSGGASGSSSGSAAGGGNPAGNGTLASAARAGSPNGSPNGSSPDGVNISGGGRPIAADIPRARPPILDNPPGPQDLPVRVIGLAMSLPSSSYFSNYEVFIAERRISKDESQLIKLVYQSLPYQRRLSEYGLNNARVFKLRVIRDPSCDESLMQMTWPDADQSKPGSPPPSDSPELNSSARSDKLPCYRTTADDYRKAISRRR
jgi:hypothetical protein